MIVPAITASASAPAWTLCMVRRRSRLRMSVSYTPLGSAGRPASASPRRRRSSSATVVRLLLVSDPKGFRERRSGPRQRALHGSLARAESRRGLARVELEVVTQDDRLALPTRKRRQRPLDVHAVGVRLAEVGHIQARLRRRSERSRLSPLLDRFSATV